MPPKPAGVLMASSPGVGSSLKRELLLVDRIGLAGLNENRDAVAAELGRLSGTPVDLDFLEESRVVFHLNMTLDLALLDDQDGRDAINAAGQATERVYQAEATLPQRASWDDLPVVVRAMNDWSREVMISRSYVSRAIAIQFRRSTGQDAVSMLPVEPIDAATTASRSDVLRIILEGLPLPDDSVPWEALLDFRRENSRRLTALHTWASEVARGQLAVVEARQKFEYLREEYIAAFRTARLKAISGILVEIVVETAATLGTDFGPAAVVIAGAKMVRALAKLFPGEENVPGREISYVVAARRHFAR